MTRVHRHHAQPGASGAIGTVYHKRAEPKRKPSYKVVLEEVTEKKKLITLVSRPQIRQHSLVKTIPDHGKAFLTRGSSTRVYVHTGG